MKLWWLSRISPGWQYFKPGIIICMTGDKNTTIAYKTPESGNQIRHIQNSLEANPEPFLSYTNYKHIKMTWTRTILTRPHLAEGIPCTFLLEGWNLYPTPYPLLGTTPHTISRFLGRPLDQGLWLLLSSGPWHLLSHRAPLPRSHNRLVCNILATSSDQITHRHNLPLGSRSRHWMLLLWHQVAAWSSRQLRRFWHQGGKPETA